MVFTKSIRLFTNPAKYVVCQYSILHIEAIMVLKIPVTMRLWTFIVGAILSFTIGVWWCRYIVPRPEPLNTRICEELRNAVMPKKPQNLQDEIQSRDFLFIGVITSQKFLSTRAKGVYDTWGNKIPGRLVFFAGKGDTTPTVNFPVVYLDVPDNVHPPQRKSLAMIKYIHDNFIDKFQWFIRADDDVYIRTGKLMAYLSKIDSSEALLLGQAGQGKKDEYGKLGLRDGDNFCIGGPSIIMSQGVLEMVTPHLQHCLNNTATSHEDTEVGRCLRNFAGVMCPWAYEAKELFHHVYNNQEKAYHASLTTPEISSAITLHPIKDAAYMRRLHVHFITMATRELDHKAWLLRHRLDNSRGAAKRFVTTKVTNASKVMLLNRANFFGSIFNNSSQPWEHFNTRQVFSVAEKAPLRWIHDSLRDGLVRVVRKGKKIIQSEGEMKGYHAMRFGKDISGYSRYHPVFGFQYKIHLNSVNLIQHFARQKQKKTITKKWLQFQQPYTPLQLRTVPNHHTETVHFVVPLAGRLENFRRFLSSFEKAFLRHDKKVKLLVVYFPKLKSPKKHQKVLSMYKKKYPQGVFHWLNVNTAIFQRGLALNMGSKYFGKGALLSFTDVDLVFDTEYLYRCRVNTIPKEQIYFPIMFSQFHPNVTRTGKAKPKNLFTFGKDVGLWRIYSYGPVCIYSDDVTSVNGFNTSILGWGLEDIEFFEKFVKSGRFKVFRAPDRGLLHVFHKHAPCSPKSSFKQQKMCRDAKAAYLSSSSSALDHLFKKEILKYKDYF